MIKFNKRSAFSLVLCAMLVFCVGFYSSAQPTTAWFTQLNDNTSGQYQMEELNVVFTGDGLDESSARLDLEFKAATKLQDKDERDNMFEHAAEFYVFSAKNLGTLDADILVDVVDSTNQDDIMTSSLFDNGVRYYIYELDTSAPVAAENVVGILGVDESDPNIAYKEIYVDTANNDRRVVKYNGNYYPTGLSEKLFSKIETDNPALSTADEQISFLKSVSSESVALSAGSTKVYCICFWVDYDAFASVLSDGNTGIRTLALNVDIKLNAVQHIDKAESVTT